LLAEHAPEIWIAIGGVIAGALGGSLLTLRLTRTNRVSGSGHVTDQSNSRVGGDQIGGNKTHK
jgi:hypothetical protein